MEIKPKSIKFVCAKTETKMKTQKTCNLRLCKIKRYNCANDKLII